MPETEAEPSMTEAERFQIPPKVHARRFDDEIVLVHLGAGAYFSLDSVGATIWDQLAAGKTPDETVAMLLALYEVKEPAARADVQRLAEELLAAGLLEPRP
jgi:hypothetical protein